MAEGISGASRYISLRGKILAGVLLLLALLVTGTLAIVRQAQKRALSNEVEAKISALASGLVVQLTTMLAAGDWASVGRTVQDASLTEEVRFLAVLDESKRVRAQSRILGERLVAQLRDLGGGEEAGGHWSFDTTLDDGSFVRVLVAPLAVAGERRGEILIGFNLDRILEEVSRLGRTVLLLGFFGLLAGTLVTFLLARSVTGPIERLKEAAVKIGAGDFGRTVEVETRDEIGALAETFNTMSIELKKREEEIRRSERLSAIGTTASVIAHEMKTPLQSVLTYTEMLRFKYDDREYRERLTEVVLPQISRLGTLVDDLLDYSRETRLSPTSLDLSFQLRQAVNFFGDILVSHRVIAREDYRAERMVRGDPDKLEQVFFNLIKNAIEAQPDGGAIVVATIDQAESVIVMVADGGEGVPEETAQRLFEPFFSTKSKGTGLGLAITQKIVAAHHGEIGLRSPLGELEESHLSVVRDVFGDLWPGLEHGTCFTVRLPAAGDTAG